MSSKVIRIGVAVVLAAVGTIVLIHYVESARDEAVAGEAAVNVIVVDRPIPKGTAGADMALMVHTEQVPEKVRAEGAISDLTSVAELRTSVDLVPGEQVVRARFITPGESARSEAPPGLLQVTVMLEPERVLGGHLRPGDKVAVVVTGANVTQSSSSSAAPPSVGSTSVELHQIQVTAIQGQPLATGAGSTNEGVGETPSGAYLVTLAGDSAAIEKIVAAKETGKIWLSAEPAEAKSSAVGGNATGTTGAPS